MQFGVGVGEIVIQAYKGFVTLLDCVGVFIRKRVSKLYVLDLDLKNIIEVDRK